MAWLRECLDNLVVHEDEMRANLATLMRRLGTGETESPDVGEAGPLVDRALASRPFGDGQEVP